MQDLIYEFRTYRLRPGEAPRYLTMLHAGGAAIVSRHLPLLGFWMTETGRLNVLHHLWAYESLDERAACRAGLMADAAWVEGFVPQAFPLLEEQEGRLMRLSSGSGALEAAVARRRQPLAAAAAGATPLAATLHRLALGGSPARTSADIGHFATVSGEAPGSAVSIAAGDLLESPGEGVARHELMRPAAFSPLR